MKDIVRSSRSSVFVNNLVHPAAERFAVCRRALFVSGSVLAVNREPFPLCKRLCVIVKTTRIHIKLNERLGYAYV